MAPEKTTREGTSNKQKIIAFILIIVLIIIGWQVLGFFRSPNTAAPPTMTATRSTPTPPSNAAAPLPNEPAAAPAPAPMATGQPANVATGQLPPVREAPVLMDSQVADLQKKSDQKYVEQLNQLQLLKVQREIAETNQAIASARLATVTAEKSVSDLLTTPSAPSGVKVAGTTTVANYTTETGVPIPLPVAEAPPPPPPITTPIPPVAPAIEYNVVSVSMQLCRWSAVITYQDKYYNVSIGDVLPLDGSVVTSISKNGVTLLRKGKRRRLHITSTV